MPKKLTQEEAISKMKSLEPNYNFDMFEYKNAITRSTVICDKSHQYEVTYNNFVHGKSRCPYCSGNKHYTDPIEKMKVLEPNYDFSNFIYTHSHNKSIIVCDQGHNFSCNYNHFVHDKSRCPICKGTKARERFSLHPFKALVRTIRAEPSYDYKYFEYINAHTKSTIICSKGHLYNVSYSEFINHGSRCPRCAKQKSEPEFEIINFIKTFYVQDIIQSCRNIIKNPRTNCYLELDIYLPDIKLAIEFNGKYWHSDKNVQKSGWSSADEKHNTKTQLCLDKGICLIHIDENEWVSNKDKCLYLIKEQILKRL